MIFTMALRMAETRINVTLTYILQIFACEL